MLQSSNNILHGNGPCATRVLCTVYVLCESDAVMLHSVSAKANAFNIMEANRMV